jgi:ABC transporter substrate binding protein
MEEFQQAIIHSRVLPNLARQFANYVHRNSNKRRAQATVHQLGETWAAQGSHNSFRKRLIGWVGRMDETFRSSLAGVALMTSKTRKANELVALAPDVILTGGGTGAELMLKATRTIPIVFVIIPDPVGSGLVERLASAGWQRDWLHDVWVQLV